MAEIRQIHRLSSGADLQCKCSRQQPVKVCLASFLFYCFPYNFLIQLSLVGFQGGGGLRFNNLRLPLTLIFQIVVGSTINILNNHQTVNYLFYNHTLKYPHQHCQESYSTHLTYRTNPTVPQLILSQYFSSLKTL